MIQIMLKLFFIYSCMHFWCMSFYTCVWVGVCACLCVLGHVQRHPVNTKCCVFIYLLMSK